MKKNYFYILAMLFAIGNLKAANKTFTVTNFSESKFFQIVTPTFAQVAPVCSGDVVAPLPTTSIEGIAGTWSPAIDNTVTTTYTFTPDVSAGATTTTMTIVVNPRPVATFTANPFPICAGTSTILAANVASANSQLVYTNLSATSVSVSINQAVFGPVLTTALPGQLVNIVNNGCTALPAGSLTGKIALIQRGVCTFALKAQNAQDAGAIAVIIYNNAAPSLIPGGTSTTVTIPVFGISQAEGLALIASMTANEVPVTLNPAQPLTYLWTNGAMTQSFNSGVLNADTVFGVTITNTVTGCVNTQNVNATVTPNIVPTFTQIAPFCAGTTAPLLPTTSTNATPLVGLWSPALVDNTTTTTYTFTPTPVAGQCLTTTTMTIEVTPITSSSLTETACDTYTWAANNQTYTSGGTYVFIDNCETKTLELTITPSSDVVTTLTECQTYTWADNGETYTQSGIYTGTTTNCVTQKLNLTITPLTVPEFTQVAPICLGDTLNALPTASNNGISGTWLPALDATTTTTYVFTPTSATCTSVASMTIEVNARPILQFFSNPFPVCSGTTAVITAESTNFVPTVNYTNSLGENIAVNANLAQFGATLTTPLSAIIVDLVNNGCAPLPAGSLTGKIALIKRGSCPFTQKVQNAQDAGAIGVILFNNVAATDLIPAGVNPAITIPVYAIRLEAGDAMIAAMTGGEISGNMSPAPTLTYLWAHGPTTKSFTTAVLTADTPYTVTVTNPATGCFVTTTVNVTVTALPVVTGNANQSFTTTGTIADIIVNPTTVVWYANAVDATAGTNPLLATQLLTNGTTYYAVATAGTCKSLPFAVTVDTNLASTDFDATTTLKVYPNPFTNLVNVSIDAKATIEIFDVVGKSIQNLTIQNGVSQIDLNTIASGVYMMKVVNEFNQSKTVRIVKN